MCCTKSLFIKNKNEQNAGYTHGCSWQSEVLAHFKSHVSFPQQAVYLDLWYWFSSQLFKRMIREINCFARVCVVLMKWAHPQWTLRPQGQSVLQSRTLKVQNPVAEEQMTYLNLGLFYVNPLRYGKVTNPNGWTSKFHRPVLCHGLDVLKDSAYKRDKLGMMRPATG